MTIHSSFHKGSKIRVILNDGTVIITKFIRKTEQNVIVTEAGEFRKRDLRSCNYYKPLPHEISPCGQI